MIRPIAISLSPNTEADDVILAIKTTLTPWTWVTGEAERELEERFKDLFNTPYVFGLNSGRSAEYLLLKALGIGKGDEVLVQAFTCVAVPNSIIWTGAKPVYVDIDSKTYNLDPADLVAKITPRTRAIIVQHTFGQPAEIETIVKIAKKHGVYLIEDCAHSLGATYKGKLIGSFGDAAFFSFGRDKVISSVFGGVIITRSKRISEDLRKLQNKLEYPSHGWVLQQLLHPILFNLLILPTYNFFGLGKFILFVLQKLDILSRAVYREEKSCDLPRVFPARLPNALAILALHQLSKVTRFNQKRRKLARFYFDSLAGFLVDLPKKDSGSTYLRFTIQAEKAGELLSFAKRWGILLGDWYNEIINPAGVDLKIAGYKKGSCPTAERVARHVVNLPTYPAMSEGDQKTVVSVIREFFKKDEQD